MIILAISRHVYNLLPFIVMGKNTLIHYLPILFNIYICDPLLVILTQANDT